MAKMPQMQICEGWKLWSSSDVEQQDRVEILRISPRNLLAAE